MFFIFCIWQIVLPLTCSKHLHYYSRLNHFIIVSLRTILNGFKHETTKVSDNFFSLQSLTFLLRVVVSQWHSGSRQPSIHHSVIDFDYLMLNMRRSRNLADLHNSIRAKIDVWRWFMLQIHYVVWSGVIYCIRTSSWTQREIKTNIEFLVNNHFMSNVSYTRSEEYTRGFDVKTSELSLLHIIIFLCRIHNITYRKWLK